MRQALLAAWFLWRHRAHWVEGHIVPTSGTYADPLGLRLLLGLKCKTCLYGLVIRIPQVAQPTYVRRKG